jgi:molybdenum cofactor cytidylyltransferase
MKLKRVTGLILAAGKSERMGRLKPLLPFAGKTFLEQIVSEVGQSGVVNYKIILGHHSPEILTRLPQFQEACLINPTYEQGQLSSLQAGLRAIMDAPVDGVLVCLVDHPLINHHIIDHIIREFSTHENPIVIPSFNHRRGHPVIFGRELFEEILTAPIEQGAMAIVRKYQDSILHVEVDDEGILTDVDTEEDYRQLLLKYEQMKSNG